MKKFEVLTSGIFKENPIFVLMLGLCPTLGVTSYSSSCMFKWFDITF